MILEKKKNFISITHTTITIFLCPLVMLYEKLFKINFFGKMVFYNSDISDIQNKNCMRVNAK